MSFKNLCVLVLWAKVASALEGLRCQYVSPVQSAMAYPAWCALCVAGNCRAPLWVRSWWPRPRWPRPHPGGAAWSSLAAASPATPTSSCGTPPTHAAQPMIIMIIIMKIMFFSCRCLACNAHFFLWYSTHARRSAYDNNDNNNDNNENNVLLLPLPRLQRPLLLVVLHPRTPLSLQ